MTDLLVILDGASEPVRGDDPTSLERASTPVLDALAQLGTLRHLRTTPDGFPAGSETGCALLLGWQPPGPVDRATLEAAARGIDVPADGVAVRVDVLAAGGVRADGVDVERAAQAMEVAAGTGARTYGTCGAGAPSSAPAVPTPPSSPVAVHRIGGHRLLVVGEPAAVDAAIRAGNDSAAALRRWPAGAMPPAGLLDERTLVIAASGAVLGLARLLGARTLTPAGYRGGAHASLVPLADAALEVLGASRDDADLVDDRDHSTRAGRPLDRIVIHVDAPDEAAHERDADLKVDALEAADDLLIAPLTAFVHEHGGVLEIAIDHGCDPSDGQHHGAPTPALRWDSEASGKLGADRGHQGDDTHAAGDATDPRDIDPEAPGLASGLDPEDLPVMALPKRRASASAQTGRRLTERWVRPLPIEDPEAVSG